VCARCADSARASPSRSGWSRSVPRSRAADQHVHDDALAQLYSGRAAACDGTTLQGVPHDRIVRAARSMHADLVVLGTHGRTGLGRLFLGSVASRIVTPALCQTVRREVSEKTMQIRGVMTRKPNHHRSRGALATAMAGMKKEQIRHLPVDDAGRLLGLITDLTCGAPSSRPP
jgi:Universal stress protein family